MFWVVAVWMMIAVAVYAFVASASQRDVSCYCGRTILRNVCEPDEALEYDLPRKLSERCGCWPPEKT